MKRKILFIGVISLLTFNSCKDYLDVKSDSRLTSDFVFQSAFEADKAVLGVYEYMRANSGIHSNGLFYDALSVGSDIEVGPELPSNGNRYSHENCYNLTPQLSDMPTSSWNGMYAVINRCNVIIDAFESNATFNSTPKNVPSTLGHLYGEIVAMRATMYYELTRCWGDVIYFTKPINSQADYENATLTDRSVIQESEMKNLSKVEPMMYHLSATDASKTAERMTKEFVEGLMARMALLRAGYALRPADYSGDGDVIQSHPVWGKMVRRTDWKQYYDTARVYLEKLINQGKAVLTTTDPRTPADKYSNPFQYIFQQGTDCRISQESIFEVSEKKGVQTERPYAFGRPSDGGSPAYPPKGYGQVRFFPTFYYGMYNPKDLRRDVTVAVTALGGVANEKMITFKKGNKSSGGLALNKWDYSRMTDKTYAVIQRQTGINAPYMRLDDMLLLLAESYAILGDEGNAKTQLLKIRQRAFNPTDPDYTRLATDTVAGLSGTKLLEFIQNERAFELAGEGQRRYDLVRWGIFGKKINELQTQMDAIISAINTQGYYTFANGNVISKYIYTKTVSQTVSGLTDLLTTTCNVPNTDPNYPILYPGWRGTAIDWTAAAGVTLKKESMAIQGLFEHLDASKVTALLNETPVKYVQTNWGADLNVDAWKTGVNGIFGGYLPSDYAANYPPRYILAIPATTIVYSKGKISNSYGFPNQ